MSASAQPEGGAVVARAITLITGDQVDVYPDGRVALRPAANRDDVTFSVRKDGSHLHVVPSDAAAPMAEKRVDARLFDVTALLDAGYGDARRDDLPLNIQYDGHDNLDFERKIPGVRVTRELPATHGAATTVRKKTTSLWRAVVGRYPGLGKVWLGDTRGDMADGQYARRVLATGPGTEVTTSIDMLREQETYDVTVNMIGSDGAPAKLASLDVITYAGRRWSNPIYTETGTVRLRLPRDRYALLGGIVEDPTQHQLVQPVLDVKGDMTVTFDARTTKPVDIAVEREDATPVYFFAGFAVSDGAGSPFLGGDYGNPAFMRTAQVGADGPKDRFLGMAQASLARRDTDGTFTSSPYAYQLAWFTPGRSHTGTRSVRDRDLATVHANYLTQGRAAPGQMLALARSTRLPGARIPFGTPLPGALPTTRTVLYSTESVAWHQELTQNQRVVDGSLLTDAVQIAPWRTYERGHGTREVWNGGAVFGPALPGPESLSNSAVQYPTYLSLGVGLFGTAPDTTGLSEVDRARTIVTRDGATICESTTQGRCSVSSGPAAGDYRVEAEATRSLGDLSTRVSLMWTWKSDGTGGDRPSPLPVSVIRFAPELDQTGSAPGDRMAVVPVQVLANPGAPNAKVTALTVDVSYDDGKTWQAEPVRGRAGDGFVVLRPPSSGYVSFRAKAIDSHGGTVEQTILHAYRLR